MIAFNLKGKKGYEIVQKVVDMLSVLQFIRVLVQVSIQLQYTIQFFVAEKGK